MKSNRYFHNLPFYVAVLCIALLPGSCEKFVIVDPPEKEISSATVFSADATAETALLHIYGSMMDGGGSYVAGFLSGLDYYGGVLSDEFLFYGYYGDYATNNTVTEMYQNNILPNNSRIASTWNSNYKFIFAANAIINGLENSPNVTPSAKARITGEAKFLRAFSHFYLVNLYGPIPFITTTDYQQNAVVSRMPVSDVFAKIITDLEEAESLLPDTYSSGRIRPNKWAASALLARAYLYTGNWEKAEETASKLIDNTALFQLTNLNDVFLKNSKEAIFQMVPPGAQLYTMEGYLFYYTATSPANTMSGVELRPNLLNAFEPGDQRKNNWVGLNGTNFYYPYKFKESSFNGTGKEYSMVLRLGEQYLVRAEARAMQNKITGANSAESDINSIRTRAGLPATTANTQTAMIDAIMQERRVELFAEWGHRWFDLKRTKRADAVLAPLKADWNSTDTLFPIPQNELSLNRSMTQNAGY